MGHLCTTDHAAPRLTYRGQNMNPSQELPTSREEYDHKLSKCLVSTAECLDAP